LIASPHCVSLGTPADFPDAIAFLFNSFEEAVVNVNSAKPFGVVPGFLFGQFNSPEEFGNREVRTIGSGVCDNITTLSTQLNLFLRIGNRIQFFRRKASKGPLVLKKDLGAKRCLDPLRVS